MSAELQSQISRYLIAHKEELPVGVLCTVTTVKTAADLKHAVAYVTIFPEGKRGGTLSALRRLSSSLNRSLFHELPIKIVPKVRFVMDDVETKAAEMELLLNQVARTLPPEDTIKTS